MLLWPTSDTTDRSPLGAPTLNGWAKLLPALLGLVLIAGCASAPSVTPTSQNELIESKVRYRYAHTLLPTLLFEDPVNLRLLLDNMGQPFLLAAWHDLARQHGLTLSDPPSDLDVVALEEEHSIIYLIRFPTPRQPAEAYYAAMVYAQGEVNYYTLEKGPASATDALPVAAFGRWLPDGTHALVGTTTEVTAASLVEFVRTRLPALAPDLCATEIVRSDN